ncbi:hypothetical protein RQP46_010124 [Phenoliferia psychrophenolica]
MLFPYNVAGKIILLGTPAEEKDGGKLNLLKAGAYKTMEVCSMLHPAPFSAVQSSFAMAECEVTYVGNTAHAAGMPCEADAAVLAYMNLSVLRQQINPSHRIHGIIVNENWVINGELSSFVLHWSYLTSFKVIPGTSKLVFGVRAPTMAEVKVCQVKVANCFEAAALATGCKHSIEWVSSFADARNNEGLAEVYKDFMTMRYSVKFPVSTELGGSGDFVSLD